MTSWPVFIPWFQHQDSGKRFSVSDYVEWPVVLVQATDWPEELTTQHWVQVTASAPTAAVAQAGEMRAVWRGPIPAQEPVQVRCVLMVDYLKPPFVYSRGQVERIALLKQQQRALEDGSFGSTWGDWETRELDASGTRFRVSPADSRQLTDTGLFVTLAI